MRRAQERMQATRPYAERIQNVIAHLALAHPEYHHPYLAEREVRRVGLIVISTDRGLCGGLNINLFKTAISAMKQWHGDGIETDLTLIGKKSNAFFKRLGGNVVATAAHLGDEPSIVQLIGVV
jgi:F-type H+-transporting ATPase subunit gamma